MKYYILVRDNKIIKAGLDYVYKIEHLPEGDVSHSRVGEDVYEKYQNIDYDKTFVNKYIGGSNEILYIYTE